MKFSKPFYGVRAGEIYPVWFQPGDECPPELESAAQACDVIDVPASPKPKKGKEQE